MDNTFTNLSTVTLYKTPMFNETDTTLFASANVRDTYFNNIPDTDKLEITDFTPLYEGRTFNIPGNYIDLKKYNTMKLYYNDSNGHTETYYCNVDNYLYVSDNTSTPVYRIDYFLTFGHLLYNKNIEVMFERRTLSNANITKNIKLDDIPTPRIKYTKHATQWAWNLIDASSEEGYFIYLNNKTIAGSAVKGFKINFNFYAGKDSSNNDVFKLIDSQTVGCYVVYADKTGLDYILQNENNDYIEKIITVHYGLTLDIENNEHYKFVDSDIDIGFGLSGGTSCGTIYMTNILPYFVDTPVGRSYSKKLPTTNVLCSDYKTYDDWNPLRTIIIQGNEFDPKDFSNDYMGTVTDVSTYSSLFQAGLYYFTILGYTYIYPIGYKDMFINKDYAFKFQSGKNFEYTSDYQNTLAYKQLLEYNSQQQKYAIENASIQTYYQNQLLANQNAQIDVSRQQNMLSYTNQVNSLNTQWLQLDLQSTSTDINKTSKLGTSLLAGISNLLSGNYFGTGSDIIGIGSTIAGTTLTKQGITYSQGLIDKTINNAKQAVMLQNQLYGLQQQANTINTRFQCDVIALNRDNALANIAISNKYNNAQPGAYKQTDFTQITNYYYTAEPYVKPYEDYSVKSNILNHYNIYGMYIGFAQNWKPGTYEGHFYDYIQGTIINNQNVLSEELTYEKYLALAERIQKGVRIWRNDKFSALDTKTRMDYTFGNLTIDNTYDVADSGYGTYASMLRYVSNERRMYLEDLCMKYILEDLYTYYEGIDYYSLSGVVGSHFMTSDYTENDRYYLYSWVSSLKYYEENYSSTQEYDDYRQYTEYLSLELANSDLTYEEKVYIYSKVKCVSLNCLLYSFRRLV